jgi:hypothetical protein
MALDKTGLKNSIKAMLNTLKTYDGTSGKEQDDAIEKFCDDLSTYIDNYVKTATVVITPADVATAVMSNGGGVVVSANNLNGTLI